VTAGFDPERLLRTLVEHEVDFIVIGLTAAWLQGSPAVTVDLDVMPRQDLDNADRLAAALNDLRARRRGHGFLELEGADFLGWHADRFDTEAGPVDVVPRAAGIGGHDDVASVVVRLGDFAVRVATLDEVIASKEALGRPKDLAALPALYAAREARDAGQ
jgi:hypothetical protein